MFKPRLRSNLAPRTLALGALVTSITLASCGGGGGGSNNTISFQKASGSATVENKASKITRDFARVFLRTASNQESELTGPEGLEVKNGDSVSTDETGQA